jgi:hypothetical protein
MINQTNVKMIQELFLCPIDMEKFDFFERTPLVLVPCVRKFSIFDRQILHHNNYFD